MTKEEFRKDLTEALANGEGRARYEAAKLQLSGLVEKVKPFDPILSEHISELLRVGENVEKYLMTFYKK